MMATDLTSKIVELDTLLAAIERARADRKTVVQCHGCFDIVHPGHVRYLEFARQQGDVLVVTLTGDAEMADAGHRPYIPQDLRAENLAALMFVDYVHIVGSPTAADVLARVKPDVYVKGREFETSSDPAFIEEKSVVESYGGRIIFSSGEVVLSSSDLLGRMSGGRRLQSHQLDRYCHRHDITADSIDQTVARFKDLHVLVVGDIVIDRYVMCDAMGVASESPVMSLVQRDERAYVGGAAIVARHIAALGAHAFLLSAGSTDATSQRVFDVLGDEGVETNLIESRPGMVEKTRFLADDTKVLKVDRAQRVPLDSVAERRAALILEQQSKIADAVIFCDFGYGMVTGSLLGRVLPTLRHNVRTLTADVSGGHANLLDFRNVDLLCPTEREVRIMLNDYASGLSSLAWRLLDQTQARHLFVTLEKRGMVVFERPGSDRRSPEWSGRLKSELLPSFGVRLVVGVGWGVGVVAAATLSLASGDGLMQTAYLGNAAAAIEIAQLGNNPVEAPALREWLGNRWELTADKGVSANSPAVV